ncbi:MAG TPA: ROK family protein [Jatrophihabitantaceae bacterium]|nr:ROK family protein [Jatrophihabitantaceae bacterium]
MTGTVVAVDVGGTNIKAALIDGSGASLRESVVPTPVASGADAVVGAIRSTVRELADAADSLAGVGVVVPGDVDADAGIARFSANLGWRDVPLRALLREDVGMPAVLDHDVRAAGLAERMIGLARGRRDCLVAVIGTGIAGVITSAGRHVPGARSLAGELGHMAVWPDGEPCPCGQRGCLERYSSAAAIARRYAQRGGEPVDAAEVVARAGSDPVAAAVWSEAVEALGISFAACTMLLDPELIVVGGGLAAAGDALLEPVRAALASRVVWREVPAVALSSLGSRAGLLGAALLAWQAAGVTDFEAWTREAAR